MLTRRTFLASTAALTAAPGRQAEADDGPRIVGFKPTELTLPPFGPIRDAIAVQGLDAGGALRLEAGQATELRLDNGLPEPLTPSWRGLRRIGGDAVPGAIAPGASAPLRIAPAEGGTALLRAAPAASCLAQRGAQAVVVVPDAVAVDVDDDRVVHLCDWLLASDGSLRFGSTPPSDTASAVITVNGAPQPSTLTVAPRSRMRLRFVNGSTQRLMVVSCAGGRPMIAAIDGQPCELFAPARGILPIGPGARYDLLLDAPDVAGREVRFTLKPTLRLAGVLEPERELLILRSEGSPRAPRAALNPLPANAALPTRIPLEAAHRLDLTVTGRPGTPDASPAGWSVNGVPGSGAAAPLLTVPRGATLVLGFTNASSVLVPLRIAGQAVRLLHAKDDGWEPYWRDTLLLPPGGRAHAALVADTPGRWTIDSGFDDLTLAGLSCCFAVTSN